MTKRQLQHEAKMKATYALLKQMQTPMSGVDLERLNGRRSGVYSAALRTLAEEGLIVRAGDRRKEKLWVAVEQINPDEPPKEPSLADAHFVYNVNRYEEKHIQSARLARLERKSAKVYVSGEQAYA